MWLTVDKGTLKHHRSLYEHRVLVRLAELPPSNVKMCVVADRCFGDQKLNRLLTEELYFGQVIRSAELTVSQDSVPPGWKHYHPAGGQRHWCHRGSHAQAACDRASGKRAMSVRSILAVVIFAVVVAGLVFGTVELLLSESATTSASITASPRPPPPPSADQRGQKASPPSVPPVPTPAVPVPPVTAPAYPVAASSADLVPARAYLKNTEIPPKGVGAYGLVALHAKPTSATAVRLMLACTAFVSSLERQADRPSSVAVGDQMLTIWPLDDASAPEAKADKCQFLLEHYDIYSADAAMKDAAKQKADFRGRGPFLLGWSPSNTRGNPDKLVLVIDMSAYTTQADFEHAFRQWKDKIVQDPQLWRQGWSLENLRLVIRDFADRYGHDILFAAHLSDGSGKKN